MKKLIPLLAAGCMSFAVFTVHAQGMTGNENRTETSTGAEQMNSSTMQNDDTTKPMKKHKMKKMKHKKMDESGKTMDEKNRDQMDKGDGQMNGGTPKQ